MGFSTNLVQRNIWLDSFSELAENEQIKTHLEFTALNLLLTRIEEDGYSKVHQFSDTGAASAFVDGIYGNPPHEITLPEIDQTYRFVQTCRYDGYFRGNFQVPVTTTWEVLTEDKKYEQPQPQEWMVQWEDWVEKNMSGQKTSEISKYTESMAASIEAKFTELKVTEAERSLIFKRGGFRYLNKEDIEAYIYQQFRTTRLSKQFVGTLLRIVGEIEKEFEKTPR